MPRRIDLPPPAPSGGGLLANALPMPAGWERGVTFGTDGCIAPFVVGECPTASDLKPTHRPGQATFSPVSVGAALACSTIGNPAGVDASSVLDQIASTALAREFALGIASARDTAPGNPSLYGSPTHDLGDAADPVEALACLEDTAAALAHGRTVWVHVAPSTGTRLKDAGVIRRDGTTWRTAVGNVVIIDRGYAVLAPSGPSTITTVPMFATLPVYAAIGHRDNLQAVDRATNTTESRAEDLAIAVFDPCLVLVVGTGIDVCAAPLPAYVPPRSCTTVGEWAAQAAAPAGAGELQLTPTVLAINGTDNGGADQSTVLAAIAAGDTVYVLGQTGHVEVVASGPAVESGGVYTVPGAHADQGTPPTASDAVTVCVELANPPAGGGGPNPPPPPPPADPCADAPGQSDLKADIIGWLHDGGVHIDVGQVDAFTKAELLSIVRDLCDADMDPSGVNATLDG